LTSLLPNSLSSGDSVCAGLAGNSCPLPVLPSGPRAGGAALQSKRAVVSESHGEKVPGRSLCITHNLQGHWAPTHEGSDQAHALTHCPMSSFSQPMENPSTAAQPHRGNFFSLFLTSALSEEPNLHTYALRKSHFITEMRHERPTASPCHTHENRSLGQTGWVHAPGEVECLQTFLGKQDYHK